MRNPRKCLLGIACFTILAGLSAGCVDPETTGPGGSDGTGTTTSSETGGAGGEAGQGGEAGSGGQGGDGGQGGHGGNPVEEHAVADWASAGGTSKSSNFKMVFTVGQPTSNTQKSTSSSYRMQGGLNGASGSEQ